MTTVAIIQARMGSTRLPGKVLMDLNGETMLERVVRRVGRAKAVDAVVVATSVLPADDSIAVECERLGVAAYRGSESDVLDRYYHAAQTAGASTVIRITSDCPLIDPGLVDKVVGLHVQGSDYTSNSLEPRTYPRGLDVEAMTWEALQTAWTEAQSPPEREHVTPFLYRHPERFKLSALRNESDFSALRWTVDTPEDLELVRRIYSAFHGTDEFLWTEVLALFEHNPAWMSINAAVQQKPVQESL